MCRTHGLCEPSRITVDRMVWWILLFLLDHLMMTFLLGGREVELNCNLCLKIINGQYIVSLYRRRSV